MPRSLTHSHPRPGRSPLMSAVTFRHRVPHRPTCKLPRLTIDTDPVGDPLDASYGAEIPRTPGADHDCALMIPLRWLSHLGLSYSSPNGPSDGAQIVRDAVESDKTPRYPFLRRSRRKEILPREYFLRKKNVRRVIETVYTRGRSDANRSVAAERWRSGRVLCRTILNRAARR